MSKKRFVEFYLAAMLKAATDGFVIRLIYDYQNETGRETVLIHTEGGPQRITVTGDGLLAIAYDVLEALDVPADSDGRERERERETPHCPGRSSLKDVSPE